ncbi:hypothetical protein CEXT_687751 [Caerostris extrusa]|uniref:Uncharacterized protein n=1 Tax=Caerostris extrusa TaxID=172846 RepID=A0AAV4QTJ4_CAEEX|nr:hypothetical protein CEXT_687751 [Caerostris extrusa]
MCSREEHRNTSSNLSDMTACGDDKLSGKSSSGNNKKKNQGQKVAKQVNLGEQELPSLTNSWWLWRTSSRQPAICRYVNDLTWLCL